MNRYRVEVSRYVKECVSITVEAPDRKSIQVRLEDVTNVVKNDTIGNWDSDWEVDFETTPEYRSYIYKEEEDYDPNESPYIIWEEIK